MTPDPSKPVLLIDLSAIFRAAWHANPDGPTSVSFDATLDGVRRCANVVGDSPLVAICCDGRGNWRKALSPEYKAHREKQPEAMYGLLDRIKARLVDDGYLLWTADGYEADDVIATATARALIQGHEVVVASHDKDLLQLVTNHVKFLKTSTWEFVTPLDVFNKWKIEPEYMGDLLALVGDKSDGVAGVPSVGPITAAALLIKHGGLDGIYKKVDALQVFESPTGPFCETKTPATAAVGTPAIVDKLWRHKNTAMLARKLVTLKDDAPIEYEAIYQERQVMTTKNSTNTDLDAQGDIFAREEEKPRPTTGTSAPAATEATAPVPETTTTSPAADAAPPETASTAAAATVTESTALVPVEVEYIHALEPRTGGQAFKLGELLFESRAFTRFPTAGAITATIMRGRELGYSALAALDAWHFVADLGRILPSWQVIVDLAEKSPNCRYFRWVGGDDKSQTWETWHKDHAEPQRLTYTYAQAERTGLVKPDKPRSAWMARPDEMLRKTAACQLARAVYPGATLGLYSSAEMGGEE